jgi:hypothetical protein
VTKEIMPARASHLPTHIERTALQKLRERGELSERGLEPTALPTITKMKTKGRIERGRGGDTYRITPTDEESLRTPMLLRQPTGRYAQR